MSPIQELPYYLLLKKKKKKKKNNNNNPWNNTRLLFSSLGFISRIIFESSVVERYLLCVSTSLFLPLSFSLSGRWFRRKFLEHRKKNSAALRGRHEIASRKLNFGYSRNKGGKKGGRRVFRARIDMENTITRGGMHIYPLDGNSPASRIWWRNWRVLKGGWVGSGWYTGEGVVGPSNSAALSAGDIFIRG